MAIADLDAYKALLHNGEALPVTIVNVTAVAGRLYDVWVSTPPVGAVPTTAAAPTSATAGAIPFTNGSGRLNLIGARLNGLNAGTYLVVDRLSHQGGLSGIVTTAQTTNLPTAALTRYTDGVGVMIGLTIYTQIGTTATTVTCSYTNQAGTSGRTTTAVVFGGTGFREVNRLITLPLQAGDTGCQSVQSVTVLATTGTAGAFGVVLYKPLFAIGLESMHGVLNSGFVTGGGGGGIPEIVDNACLSIIAISGSTNPTAAGALLTGDA